MSVRALRLCYHPHAFFILAVWLGAVGKDLQCVLANFKAKITAHGLLLFFNLRIGKLKNLATLVADYMVVMFIAICALVVQVLMTKTVLAD
jgi:hypothetical protein